MFSDTCHECRTVSLKIFTRSLVAARTTSMLSASVKYWYTPPKAFLLKLGEVSLSLSIMNRARSTRAYTRTITNEKAVFEIASTQSVKTLYSISVYRHMYIYVIIKCHTVYNITVV